MRTNFFERRTASGAKRWTRHDAEFTTRVGFILVPPVVAALVSAPGSGGAAHGVRSQFLPRRRARREIRPGLLDRGAASHQPLRRAGVRPRPDGRALFPPLRRL